VFYPVLVKEIFDMKEFRIREYYTNTMRLALFVDGKYHYDRVNAIRRWLENNNLDYFVKKIHWDDQRRYPRKYFITFKKRHCVMAAKIILGGE
jgi:hypothetical protein